MKKKIAYITITAVISLTAFFTGKNSAPDQDLNAYIPVSDFYATSIDENGYLTLHVGDYSHVGDELTGRTYKSVVAEINQR